MKKSYIFAVLTALLLSGCNSSGKEAAYETESFSFSLNDSFKRSQSAEKNDGDLCFMFENNANTIYIYEQYYLNMDINAHGDDLAEFYADEDGIEVVSSGIYGENGNIYVVEMKSDGNNVNNYILLEENKVLNITASFEEKNAEKLGAMLDRMLDSVKYTGDFHFPQNNQTFKNDYFSVEYPPEWTASDINGGISLKYKYADSKEKSFTSVIAEPIIDAEYTDAGKLAESRLKTLLGGGNAVDLEMAEDDFNGKKAVKLSYKISLDDDVFVNQEYYFKTEKGLFRLRLLFHEGAFDEAYEDAMGLAEKVSFA